MFHRRKAYMPSKFFDQGCSDEAQHAVFVDVGWAGQASYTIEGVTFLTPSITMEGDGEAVVSLCKTSNLWLVVGSLQRPQTVEDRRSSLRKRGWMMLPSKSCREKQ